MSAFTSKYKSTPTFTFKGRSKSVTNSNDPINLPSPQQYNPQKITLKKLPQFKFPQATRKQWEQVKSKQMFPGPGAHEAKSFIDQGLKKSISRTLFEHKIPLTPSPGQYNPDMLQFKAKQPSFTIQKKTISSHDLIASQNIYTPSPAKYQQPILKFKSESIISIGKGKRKWLANLNKTPGPGSYEMQKSYASSVSSLSKCKIGKQKRKIDFSIGQKSPGPGTYQKKTFIEQNKAKKIGFTCRQKLNQTQLKTPGPGSYQTPKISRFNSSPIMKIGKSQRFDFIDKSKKLFGENPGPGSFDFENQGKMKFRSMSVHKFSKSKQNYLTKSFKNQISQKLGPGCYRINSSLTEKNEPKFSISVNQDRGLFKKIIKVPGPGQYTPKTQLIYEAQFTHKLQTSQRSNTIKHLVNFPGPGQYQNQDNQRLGRKFKFSKQKKLNYTQQKIRKQKVSTHQTFQERQQFPNPPRYMAVSSKFKINQKNIRKYA